MLTGSVHLVVVLIYPIVPGVTQSAQGAHSIVAPSQAAVLLAIWQYGWHHGAKRDTLPVELSQTLLIYLL